MRPNNNKCSKNFDERPRSRGGVEGKLKVTLECVSITDEGIGAVAYVRAVRPVHAVAFHQVAPMCCQKLL